MASSGNFVNDILTRYLCPALKPSSLLHLSHLVTLVVGLVAIVIASRFEKVLEAILFAYSFMVSGLFVPTLGAYFWRQSSSSGALFGMLAGGTVTLLLETGVVQMPRRLVETGLNPAMYGLVASTIVFVGLSLLHPDRRRVK
jgi:SSS family solute:Na+ symporter